MGGFKPQELANTAWAFATVAQADEELTAAVAMASAFLPRTRNGGANLPHLLPSQLASIPLCHKPSKASEDNHIHKPQPYCPEITKGVNVHICVLDRHTSKRKVHSSTKHIWKCGYWILATETFDPVEQNTNTQDISD